MSKIMINPKFKPLQFAFGVAFQKGGIVVNLPPYTKRRTDYLMAVMMWPLQVTITIQTGDLDAFSGDFGA